MNTKDRLLQNAKRGILSLKDTKYIRDRIAKIDQYDPDAYRLVHLVGLAGLESCESDVFRLTLSTDDTDMIYIGFTVLIYYLEKIENYKETLIDYISADPQKFPDLVFESLRGCPRILSKYKDKKIMRGVLQAMLNPNLCDYARASCQDALLCYLDEENSRKSNVITSKECVSLDDIHPCILEKFADEISPLASRVH